MISLSSAQAARLALRAQGLGARPRPTDRETPGAVTAMLHRLGAVQLDTISVLARSHELVAYARLGAVRREQVEAGYWADPGVAFEYWSHAACLLPIASYPLFAFRRRDFLARGKRWHDVPHQLLDDIRARLRSEGPLTAGQLGGAKAGSDWWNWSNTKIAVEWLWDIGEVVVTRRTGWRRVYDLAERALPDELARVELDDHECHRQLVQAAGRTLGVATVSDLADAHRLTGAQVRAVLPDTGLVEVEVDGWGSTGFADPGALGAIDDSFRSRTALLSPFDSLVWQRERTRRLFQIDHRLEAYTPAAKRVHGYFSMPVLHRGQLIGQVDPGRRGGAADRVLLAKHVQFDRRPDAANAAGMARALRNAASWVQAHDVVVERVTPPSAAALLRSALVG